MADEKNKAFEDVVENNAENGVETNTEIRAEELEEVAGGIIPPWPGSSTK